MLYTENFDTNVVANGVTYTTYKIAVDLLYQSKIQVINF